MGRRKKLNIDLSSIDSLQELMQEVYHDACAQIKESQNSITNLVNSTEPLDVDDHAKISKAKTDFLKVRDSAIKAKLDVAKLQNEVLKRKGEVENGDTPKGHVGQPGSVGLDDFSRIRAYIKDNEKGDDE